LHFVEFLKEANLLLAVKFQELEPASFFNFVFSDDFLSGLPLPDPGPEFISFFFFDVFL